MITNPRRAGRANILLVEDDRPLARLTEVALKRTAIPHDLRIVHDGHQAIAALAETTPDLCLLDLYMPGTDGFHVLEHVRSDERLRRLPVVMLSYSGAPEDVNRAYDLHVNAYVVKQTDFSDLCSTVDSIVNFWLQVVTPPFSM